MMIAIAVGKSAARKCRRPPTQPITRMIIRVMTMTEFTIMMMPNATTFRCKYDNFMMTNTTMNVIIVKNNQPDNDVRRQIPTHCQLYLLYNFPLILKTTTTTTRATTKRSHNNKNNCCCKIIYNIKQIFLEH